MSDYPSKRDLVARMAANKLQVFSVDARQAKQARADVSKLPHMSSEVAQLVGWYFATPDGTPSGPYRTPSAALRAAYDADYLPDSQHAI